MARVARVIPDVAGIEAEFDYAIPHEFDALVTVGTIVRVVLHGRRVRGWVVNADSTPPEGVRLLEIQKVTGQGPSAEIFDLARWASWRWAGRRSFFLQTASPPRAVAKISSSQMAASADSLGPRALVNEVVRIPPAQSPLIEVLAAGANGTTLLITPAQRSAEGWARRLRAEGKSVALLPDQWQMAAEGRANYVVGTRAAAWGPAPELSAVVVVDAHDEGLQSEASPTWNAVDVVTERAQRAKASIHLISSVPRIETMPDRTLRTLERAAEKRGWAPLTVVDRRGSDPRTGMYSPELVTALRSEKHVVCVLNRKGRAQLLVCSRCDEMARCPHCSGAQIIAGEDLECSRCHIAQPVLCLHCGSTKFKQLRQGVQRVREDLESLALRPVGEVTGDTDELPTTDALVGTEAVLHRVQRADVVVFLDFDQDLLAARYRATEDALILLARAARLVGGQSRGGIVMVQTRQPEHEVVQAAVYGDPERFSAAEALRRTEMNWPPASAMARISGANSASYVAKLQQVDVLSMDEKTHLAMAKDHQELCQALAANPRPSSGGLRVEVDPSRV